MINLIISAIFQLVLFTAIPFLIYSFIAKDKIGFLNYLGLKETVSTNFFYPIIFSVALCVIPILLIEYSHSFSDIFNNAFLVSGKFDKNNGLFNCIGSIFIVSYFQTALTEEIFFRGFIGKQLLKKKSFTFSNIAQGLIFAFLHLGMGFAITKNPVFLIFSFVFPLIFSMIGFYLNEKKSGGSIFPSILLHGTSNFIFYLFYVYTSNS